MAFAEAITQCGGAGIGSRTMCDATLPAADVFRMRAGTAAMRQIAAAFGADSTINRGDARPVGLPGGGDAARRRRPGRARLAIAFAAVAGARSHGWSTTGSLRWFTAHRFSTAKKVLVAKNVARRMFSHRLLAEETHLNEETHPPPLVPPLGSLLVSPRLVTRNSRSSLGLCISLCGMPSRCLVGLSDLAGRLSSLSVSS